MRFAIVESGGKQYRVVEGRAIQVDRLPVEIGTQYNVERVLLMADGDDVMVGTPTVDGIDVKVTVVDHIKGPKLISFKYRPKKRIRVKGGHRQQYTLLMVDSIGKPGESRKKAEKPVEKKAEVVEAEPKAEDKKQAKAKKEATSSPKGKPKSEKAPAKKSATSKSSSKKTEKK
ncbi:MAG TPA: 50S ribosomal protein L21 [Anaerolineales bacterium]